MTKLSPIASEFASSEEAEGYARWLAAKVAESLTDRRPSVSHEKAMTKVRGTLSMKTDKS